MPHPKPPDIQEGMDAESYRVVTISLPSTVPAPPPAVLTRRVLDRGGGRDQGMSSNARRRLAIPCRSRGVSLVIVAHTTFQSRSSP